jgi:hypothetical protein
MLSLIGCYSVFTRPSSKSRPTPGSVEMHGRIGMPRRPSPLPTPRSFQIRSHRDGTGYGTRSDSLLPHWETWRTHVRVLSCYTGAVEQIARVLCWVSPLGCQLHTHAHTHTHWHGGCESVGDCPPVCYSVTSWCLCCAPEWNSIP